MITLSMMMRFIVFVMIVVLCPIVLSDFIGRPFGFIIGVVIGLILALGVWYVLRRI